MRLNTQSLYKLYCLTCYFVLFQKSLDFEKTKELVDERDKEKGFNRIRCPLCNWQPHSSDLWQCSDVSYPEYFYNGCWTSWNTFDTRGLCPGCNHQWRWTGCLSCGSWSLHEDWYSTNDE